VVIVKIYDQNALFVGARGDRNVVEKAEAHAAIRLGMVSRRTHESENGLFSGYAGLNGGDGSAGGAYGSPIRTRIDHRIAGGKIPRRCLGRTGNSLDVTLYQVVIALRMDALDLGVGRIARSDLFRQNAARAQAGSNGFDTVGALGMSDAPQVIAVVRIGDELQPECALAGGFVGA